MERDNGVAKVFVGVCLLAGIGCRDKAPVLVLDKMESADLAKSGCSVPIDRGEACVILSRDEIGSYMSSMATSFLEDPHCHGIKLIEGGWYPNDLTPEEISAPWRVHVNWSMREDEKPSAFTWSMNDNRDLRHFAKGPTNGQDTESPNNAVRSICAIIKGDGGSWAKVAKK